MKKILSKAKGITLIALVITIIIIIILAGVAINLSIGENGIFKKSKQAREEYINAQIAEEKGINDIYGQLLVSTDGTANVNVEKLEQIILNKTYPVGSIYISTSPANPKDLFGGEWQSFGQGRTLIGAGEGTDTNNENKTFTAGATGGEYNHKLTIAEMPSHNHGINTLRYIYQLVANSGHAGTTGSTGWDAGAPSSAISINNTGGSEFHNNIQPYIVTYMWQRTK